MAVTLNRVAQQVLFVGAEAADQVIQMGLSGQADQPLASRVQTHGVTRYVHGEQADTGKTTYGGQTPDRGDALFAFMAATAAQGQDQHHQNQQAQ